MPRWIVHPERPAWFVVEYDMKFWARAVLLGVAGLALVSLFAAAALTNEPPSSLIRPLADGSTNLELKPFHSTPIVHLHGKPGLSPPLKPGVYQTRPYAIILIVPEAGLDDRCVVRSSGNIAKMPNVMPDIQAVPKTSSQ